jgi:hypothetical protein
VLVRRSSALAVVMRHTLLDDRLGVIASLSTS